MLFEIPSSGVNLKASHSNTVRTMSKAYRVYCEDCGLDEVYDSEDPPKREVNYWGNIEKAREQWSAKSAAKGKRDNHAASEFRDYDKGVRHRVHMEEVSADE